MAPTLRALGLCGADDSVDPHLLAILSHAYPTIEFGVLFRPDRAGTPRYASDGWVGRLARVAAKSGHMKLAAHLCGSRVNELLSGDDAFVGVLWRLGFQRVQINATAVNGVDTSKLAESVESTLSVITRHPELEFILQKNDETEPLWQGLLDNAGAGKAGFLPDNVSMLVDESKGTGVPASSWPKPSPNYRIGYAGGIGPHNIDRVLQDVTAAAGDVPFWIDMESSLRSTKNGEDVFDLDRCYSVVRAACSAGLMSHPDFLP